jgi:hypothetical protein
VIAVDKLVARHEPPSAVEVCQSVYDHRGPEDWDALCPERSPGRGDPARVLKYQPLYHPIARGGQLQPDEDERSKRKPGHPFPPERRQIQRITFVAGASLGRPFGIGAGIGPALSGGLILSQHETRSPAGPLLQAKWSGRNVILGLGYGAGVEYNPFRNTLGKQKNSIIWGFGPAVGFGIKGAYMRAAGENLFGTELEVVVFKIRLAAGRFWRAHAGARWTWDFGTGF